MAGSNDFDGYSLTEGGVAFQENLVEDAINPSPLLNNDAPVADQKVSSDSAEDMKREIRRLQFELDEARSLVAVANYSLEESLETERRKCQEEVATLQQLMKGTTVNFSVKKLL